MDFDPFEAIAHHSFGLADAASRDLDARVEHCPEWSVADLVDHVTEVHWFWRTIAEERLSEPPGDDRRPGKATDKLGALRKGAVGLVATLSEADQSAPVWTWAPQQMDIAFITRHQVQEAAVHHWDAANAVGESIEIAPAVAADCIDEFLTFSVACAAWPAGPELQPIGKQFALRCNDFKGAWTIGDGPERTVAITPGVADGIPVLEASAAELLLWLYGRVSIGTDVDPEMLARFTAVTYTT